MSTILYDSPIFGPVHSRRLGLSLGINLMPPDGKLCTFDCIYCECGLNAEHRPSLSRPTREAVATALEARLVEMVAGNTPPDVLTFAGNGEPTAHPDFPGIIDDTLALRARYCPQAKVSVLSNATLAHLPKIRAALLKVDNNILKLDTVDAGYIHLVDRPTGRYDVEAVVQTLKSYGQQAIVQTLFMKGRDKNGNDVDNTTDRYVLPWIEAIRSIAPRQVMIYTIDRDTPVQGLRKASPQELDRIADLLRAEGIAVSVSY